MKNRAHTALSHVCDTGRVPTERCSDVFVRPLAWLPGGLASGSKVGKDDAIDKNGKRNAQVVESRTQPDASP